MKENNELNEDFYTELPVLIMDKLSVLPNATLPFYTKENNNRKAIDKAINSGSLLYLAVTDDNGKPREYGLRVACNKVVHTELFSVKTMLDAIEKVRFVGFMPIEGVKYAKAVDVTENEDNVSADELDAFKMLLREKIDALCEIASVSPVDHVKQSMDNASTLIELVNYSGMLIKEEYDKYPILASNDARDKFNILMTFIERDLMYASVVQEVDEAVSEKLSTQNREYILREQKKHIEQQLGDGDDEEKEELLKRIAALDCADEIKEKLNKEMARLDRMNESAPESSIIRNYLDWVLELPWNTMTEDEKDIKKVMDILNEDHYGIEKVKERILEFIAVRMLSQENAAGVSLCLVGPPGVGKTTVARSIARALNKDFVQLTLGGVHDEAEIRGHRKTYIGAMPGRIMSSLAKCKSNNPVFLLDEVDKITKDMRGDPQSALLEVLDPNQNKIFRDNFLEIPYDLSNVMFVVTANDLSTIDKPLLDRLEIIKMEGYTPIEKLNIAKQYLVAKQAKLNGLKDEEVLFTDNALNEIIEGYTREAGVRELERKIAAVCRKIAYNKVSGVDTDTCVKIDVEDIHRLLHARVYHADNNETTGVIGKAIGLAWNGYGGSTLDIEVAVMDGSGELKLTGNLGDVMKESAQIAMSIVRSRASKFGFDGEYFKKHDFHIHVPEGAVPKDGPSAGITISTAIMSALTHKPLKDCIAMTGEVSLSGKVLAIGGLKEKCLAANRLGITEILIPKDNEVDLDEVPESIKNTIKFVPMTNIDQVFKEAVQGYAD